MTAFFKNTLCGIAFLTIGAGTAFADLTTAHLYSLRFGSEGKYMAEAVLFNDAEFEGQTVTHWWVPKWKTMFYVPRESLVGFKDESKSLVGESFMGHYIDVNPYAGAIQETCSTLKTDHTGISRKIWGQVKWTVTGISPYIFQIAMDSCGKGPLNAVAEGKPN